MCSSDLDPAGYEGRPDPALAALVPSSLDVSRVAAWSSSLTRRVGVGDLGLRAWHGLWRECVRQIQRQRVDVVYITTYPVYPALIGPLAQRRFGVPYAIDFQDPWVGAWGRTVGGGPGGTVDWCSRAARAVYACLERVVVPGAAGLTAVSSATLEELLDRVHPDRRPACATLPIGVDPEDFAHLGEVSNPCFDPHDGAIHLCYVGTLLPRGMEIARALLDALHQLRQHAPALFSRVRLHAIGTSNQTDGHPEPRLQPMAAALGLGDIVDEVPRRVSYREAHLAMELICDSGRMTSAEIVEVNPVMDVANKTAVLGVELIMSALGKRIL